MGTSGRRSDDTWLKALHSVKSATNAWRWSILAVSRMGRSRKLTIIVSDARTRRVFRHLLQRPLNPTREAPARFASRPSPLLTVGRPWAKINAGRVGACLVALPTGSFLTHRKTRSRVSLSNWRPGKHPRGRPGAHFGRRRWSMCEFKRANGDECDGQTEAPPCRRCADEVCGDD